MVYPNSHQNQTQDQIQADWLTSKIMQDLRSFAIEYAKQIVAKANELVNLQSNQNNEIHTGQLASDTLRIGSQKQKFRQAADELNERLRRVWQATSETNYDNNESTFYQENQNNKDNSQAVLATIPTESILGAKRQKKNANQARFAPESELNHQPTAQTKQPGKFNENHHEYNYSAAKQPQHTTYSNPITATSSKQTTDEIAPSLSSGTSRQRKGDENCEESGFQSSGGINSGGPRRFAGFSWHPLISCLSTCLPHLIVDNLPPNLRPRKMRTNSQDDDPYAD